MNIIERIAREHFEDNGECVCGGDHLICLNCLKCRKDDPDQLFIEGSPVASIIDATVLRANTSFSDVDSLCEMALKYSCASVCVNTYYVTAVNGFLDDAVKTCTVVNFPLGAGDAEAVLAEASAAIELGIDELDMVMNLSSMLNEDPEENYETMRMVAQICMENNVLLKVILETCYLSEEQIIHSCLLAKKAGAQFVKTSTGFGTTGATIEDVQLMRRCVGPKLGVKASGGIKSKDQALAMIAAGANRIGASSVSALVD